MSEQLTWRYSIVLSEDHINQLVTTVQKSAQSMYHHPFRTLGRALVIAALIIDPPTTVFGAAAAVGAGALDLSEASENAQHEKPER